MIKNILKTLQILILIQRIFEEEHIITDEEYELYFSDSSMFIFPEFFRDKINKLLLIEKYRLRKYEFIRRKYKIEKIDFLYIIQNYINVKEIFDFSSISSYIEKKYSVINDDFLNDIFEIEKLMKKIFIFDDLIFKQAAEKYILNINALLYQNSLKNKENIYVNEYVNKLKANDDFYNLQIFINNKIIEKTEKNDMLEKERVKQEKKEI